MTVSLNPIYANPALRMASVNAGPMTLSEATVALASKQLTQAVVVEDTQTALQANLAGLQKIAAAGKLSSVSFSQGDAALQFNAQQLGASTALLTQLNEDNIAVQVIDRASNLARVASRIQTGYEVTVQDSAALVQANLTGLQTLAAAGKLDQVSFTDAGVPTVTFKAAQFANMAALRAQLSNASLAVSDTAANVANYAVSAADSVVVKDASANILKNFEAMRQLAANTADVTFTLTNRAPVMELTAAQYVGSEALRAKLPSVTFTIKDTALNVRDNADALAGLQVSVTDTAANVQSSLEELKSFADAGKLKMLKVSNASTATLTMTAAQAIKLGTVAGTSVVLEDTAANIESNFDALLAVKKLKSITLTDTARPMLQVTEAQYKKGGALLSKISGAAVAVEFARNFSDYRIQTNTDGSFTVGNNKYKNVNFFAFQDFTTFADTGDAKINAMVLGGTNYWWRDTAGAVTTSDSQIKTGVFALGEGSAKSTFTYSFMNDLPDGNTADGYGFREMTAAQQDAVRSAFTYLSSLINVTFTESNNPGQADINFGTNNQSLKNSSGYANVPNGSGDHPVYLFLDNAPGNLNTNLAQGTYGWQTLIHEIGHTLGLKHPGNYNASGGGSPGPFLTKAYDTRQYTLMSYNNPTGTMKVNATTTNNITYRYSASSVSPSTYMMFDIGALQFMYGKGTAQGLDAYQTNTFTADWSGMQTLWMPEGGVIDASAVDNANIIDLREGAFSSINVIPTSVIDSFPASLRTAATYMGLNNVGLAYGTQVASATGGTSGDVFYTSTSSDVEIDGGDGNDTVYLAGTASEWITQNNVYTNARLSRSVTLTNVEAVKFYNADTYVTTHSRLDLQA